jgi:YD repeat-containing protein
LYDDQQRLIQKRDLVGNYWQYAYTGAGVTVTWQSGGVEKYLLDSMGYHTRTESVYRDSVTEIILRNYNSNGEITELIHPGEDTVYVTWQNGNIIAAKHKNGWIENYYEYFENSDGRSILNAVEDLTHLPDTAFPSQARGFQHRFYLSHWNDVPGAKHKNSRNFLRKHTRTDHGNTIIKEREVVFDAAGRVERMIETTKYEYLPSWADTVYCTYKCF